MGFVRVESGSSPDVDLAGLVFAEPVVREFEPDYRSLQVLVVALLFGAGGEFGDGFFLVGSRGEVFWWDVVSISLGGAQ